MSMKLLNKLLKYHVLCDALFFFTLNKQKIKIYLEILNSQAETSSTDAVSDNWELFSTTADSEYHLTDVPWGSF